MKKFHQTLKEKRECAGVSQEYIAQKLGITRQAYSHYESGRTMPTVDSVFKIAEILRINVVEFMHNSEEKQVITEESHLQTIIENVNKLNSEGAKKVADYSADLVDTGNFKK